MIHETGCGSRNQCLESAFTVMNISREMAMQDRMTEIRYHGISKPSGAYRVSPG